MVKLFLGEVLEELSEIQCVEAIRLSRIAITDAVGSLFPEVFAEEIEKLMDRVNQLHREASIDNIVICPDCGHKMTAMKNAVVFHMSCEAQKMQEKRNG